MKKKLLFCLFFVSIAVGGSAINAGNASAESAYDNLINTTTDLQIRFPSTNYCSGNKVIDITENWDNVFSTNDGTFIGTDNKFFWLSDYQNAKNSWDNKVNWGVVNINKASNSDFVQQSVRIWWSESQVTGYFDNYNNYQELSLKATPNINFVDVIIDSSYQYGNKCYTVIMPYLGQYDDFTLIASSSPDNRLYFAYMNTIQYPQGYQGPNIPQSGYTPPPVKTEIDYWLNFTYSNTPQQLQAKYLNKETDPVSSAPDPEFVWWKLSTGGTHVSDDYPDYEVVCEFYGRPSVTFVTQTHCSNLQIDKSKDYYLSASINMSYEDILSDSDYDLTVKQTFYKIDFSKSSVGSTEQCTGGAIYDYMSIYCVAPAEFDVINCFQADFPWINITDCNETFGILFQHLLFGGVSFPQWNHTPQCTNLNVLDNWLGLPESYTACAQFSTEVRNIVTPFVAFLLGLITFGFLQRRGIGDFN